MHAVTKYIHVCTKKQGWSWWTILSIFHYSVYIKSFFESGLNYYFKSYSGASGHLHFLTNSPDTWFLLINVNWFPNMCPNKWINLISGIPISEVPLVLYIYLYIYIYFRTSFICPWFNFPQLTVGEFKTSRQ